jgi:putative restriction endonuclease
MQSPHSPDVIAERDRRLRLWKEATEGRAHDQLPPETLRQLRIYRGQRGIFVDCNTTRKATHDQVGVTVSVLHLGGRYDDDLGATHLVYHYPETRVPGRDAAEIRATVAAKVLQLSVFVITVGRVPTLRWIRRAEVVRQNDLAKTFDLEFKH